MVYAVLVTHGNLANELIATAKGIFGDFSGCYAVSNANKSPDTLRKELDSIIESGKEDDRFIVFVDFFGGSCCHACLAVEQRHEHAALITGINLPMLLAFLYKRDEVDFQNLPAELTSRGIGSIRVVQADDL